jgi:hypothetical protein
MHWQPAVMILLLSHSRFRFSNTLHGDLLFDDGVAIIQVTALLERFSSLL